MPERLTPPKSCHLVWMTPSGRRWFKIAGAAAFCERAVRAACAAAGCRADTVLVLPDRVHVVVRVPAAAPHRLLGTRLQRDVAAALIRARQVPSGTPVWRAEGWCAALSSPAALAVVRRQLALVGEQPAGGVHNVRRLWQDVVLEGRGIW